MKRFFVCLIFAFVVTVAFAQNVKPYTIDLNGIPAVNDDKSVTFDKKTKTITVTKEILEQRGTGLYVGQNISDFNILRIKYKTLDDIGFHLFIEYENDNLDEYENSWWDRNTYCPSYLTEMVIPLKKGMNKLHAIGFYSVNGFKEERFIIESITLENVSNPEKTDIWASNEPAVIDTATSGKIDDKISSWDYVQKLGVGFQYSPFGSMSKGDQDFGLDSYLCWGWRKPTKEEIHFLKEKGFNAIRLQTSPNVHIIDENYTIDPRFIKALKEVVDWAIEDDMYVIICGPFSDPMLDEYYRKKVENSVHYAGISVSENYKEKSEALIKAVWTQYAAAFNNSYDEHLIFETLNEPADCFHEHGASPRTDCAVCKKDFAILNEYNQLIVDTIRASGGNNAKRFIIIEGLGFAKYEYITTKLFKLPKDKTKDRLIPTFHEYPMGGGDYYKLYYTDSIKQFITEEFKALDKTYFSKHIPVYVTEVGHPRVVPILERIASIKDFMAEVTNIKRSCAVSMHEDPGPIPSDGFRYYTRGKLEWEQSEYVDTLLYAAQGKEYPLSDDFIKKNEVKVESIVGKNLLSETHELKDWNNGFSINPNTFVRSVPAKYKLEFLVEKTGTAPILQIGYTDRAGLWNDVATRSDVKATGAVKGNNFEVKAETVTITISEKLAVAIEDSNGLFINGQDIAIKSMKVVE